MVEPPRSEHIVEENPEPGMLSRTRIADLTIDKVTPDEWERRTGMSDHVSISFPAARNVPLLDLGASVVCPACQGVGIVGEIVGMAVTCVFCVGEGSVTSVGAPRYDPEDPLGGAEPTLERLKILIHQLDPTGIKYLYQYRLDPDLIRYPYKLHWPYLRARMWLDHYGITLEQVQTEIDDEDELDDLWGFDGRNYAGKDFSAGSATGSGADRWDECDFSGSTLTGTNFHAVDLTDALFDAANLVNANLSGAKLTRVSFRDADLSGANLDDADVTGADFRGVKGLDLTALADLQARGAVVDEPCT